MGNDKSAPGDYGIEISISIHVPARGTTGISEEDATRIAISIHVPAWGTTFSVSYSFPSSYYFNPRSRVGNDDIIYLSFNRSKDFNPRSRVGNDFIVLGAADLI